MSWLSTRGSGAFFRKFIQRSTNSLDFSLSITNLTPCVINVFRYFGINYFISFPDTSTNSLWTGQRTYVPFFLFEVKTYSVKIRWGLSIEQRNDCRPSILYLSIPPTPHLPRYSIDSSNQESSVKSSIFASRNTPSFQIAISFLHLRFGHLMYSHCGSSVSSTSHPSSCA